MQPPRFEFYDPQTPIYTSPRFLPPAKVVKSKINDAIISHGSYLEECTVSNAIVGLRSRIDKGAVIQVRATRLSLGAASSKYGEPHLRCRFQPPSADQTHHIDRVPASLWRCMH